MIIFRSINWLKVISIKLIKQNKGYQTCTILRSNKLHVFSKFNWIAYSNFCWYCSLFLYNLKPITLCRKPIKALKKLWREITEYKTFFSNTSQNLTQINLPHIIMQTSKHNFIFFFQNKSKANIIYPHLYNTKTKTNPFRDNFYV